MRFEKKKVLVTSADRYMGPAIADLFEQEGADVYRSVDALRDQPSIDELMRNVGMVDILIANFAEVPHRASVDAVTDEDWHALFDALVHPLMRIVRAVAADMKGRGGKIVAVTSAAPLRGLPEHAGYCAARGAQNAFVRAAGLELAPHNIQFNAIGQNYVENNVYYPPQLIESEKFQKHVKLNVPAGQVAQSKETAELAAYLASPHCTHLVGQVIPFAGGWVTAT